MLTKVYIGVFVFVIACFSNNYTQVCCQEKYNLMLIDSKLWNTDGDTISGKIEYISQYNLQFSVTISDTNRNALSFYSPRDLKGFCFFLNGEKVFFHSVENPFDMGRMFLKIIYAGEYSVYLYLELNQRSSQLSFIPHYYLWKNGWLEPEITIPTEKEALLEHFSDCPELEYKIKTGDYSLRTIGRIIEEYQKCRLTDDYEYFFE